MVRRGVTVISCALMDTAVLKRVNTFEVLDRLDSDHQLICIACKKTEVRKKKKENDLQERKFGTEKGTSYLFKEKISRI